MPERIRTQFVALAFWRRPALKQRWRQLCDWTARALEKLAAGG